MAMVGEHQRCLLVADTPELRTRGLMNVDDLGRFDGMVFRFGEPTAGAFYMYRTRIALTIAWVGVDGIVTELTDMEPCPDDDGATCPRYRPGAPYTDAIEVPKGAAERLGLVVGARVGLGGVC